MSELVYTVTKIETQRREMTGREAELLSNLFGKIWCEAVYDPHFKDSQLFAQHILPLIEELNKTMRFKN